MASVQKRIGVIAFAKQSAVGSPASAPDYALPIVSGGVKSMRERADLPITRPTSARPGQFVTRAWGGGGQVVLAHEEAIGLLLFEAMGTQAASGTSPTKHTFTMAEALVTTPLTIWSLVGDEWEKLEDAYVTKLTLAGQSGQNITVAFEVIAKTPIGPVSAPTYTLADDEPRSKYIDSDVYLEANAAPPTLMTNVENFELVIDRTPDIKHGSSLTPSLLTPTRAVDFSVGLVYDSSQQGWDFYHASQQGTAAGGSARQDVLQGSFAVSLGRHPSSSTRMLRFYNGPAVSTPPTNIATTNWEYVAERPDADPSDGPLEMQVAGMVTDPGSSGSEVTVELFNDKAGTY